MTLEQMQVMQWMTNAGQTVKHSPSKTVDHDVVCLRLRLIGEELVELARSFGMEMEIKDGELVPFTEVFPRNVSLIGTADALADLMFVVLGTAVSCGFDMEPIFQEVYRSNRTKMVKDGNGQWTLTKDAKGKVLKPSTYEPPNLEPIIQGQML